MFFLLGGATVPMCLCLRRRVHAVDLQHLCGDWGAEAGARAEVRLPGCIEGVRQTMSILGAHDQLQQTLQFVFHVVCNVKP